jgi:hypothetical protein
MFSQIEQSGLRSGEKLSVRAAIASLDFLKTASKEIGLPIEQLNEDALIQWLKGEKQAKR